MVNKLKRHLTLTFIIVAIIIFSSGILIGRTLSIDSSNTIESLLTESEISVESYLLEKSLLENLGRDSCKFSKQRLADLSDELGKIGRNLVDMDNEKNDIKYLLKKKYHTMQIKAYLMHHKISELCGKTNTILFYYGDDSDSIDQGKILDEIVENFNVSVFAIEYNYIDSLSFVEDYYDVQSTPFLVINFNTSLDGIQSYENIEQVIKNGN